MQAIDAAAAARHPGVRAVLVDRAGETRNAALCGARSPPSPRPPRAAAEAALRRIRVDYAPLPFVVDPDVARRPNAPLVYQAGEHRSLAIAEIAVATAWR